ncbi:AAA family ATPase [Geomonas sp. RF6]|uniref:bifunctional aminoglycoside phosphotransferase/ATP-binding protein n=1 Tax=Geomonas sp. RF6 TaxID=2897342 RepID=UPI001E5930FD|nr:bifunctional aminoglycoside phosphotransferase/ATP-binding protein [Geomonas sp. RF6]UFS69679.1 AAA family ATPase [Geomonas sp. RF6]
MNLKLKKSLLKPEAYPEPTTSVRLIETHVSLLFVTDSYVYKVKKPVDFGFINFSTVDRRRFYCGEEVRLNRRLSPDLYLGVEEIRERSGAFSIGGTGQVVDYAVKMRRLPEERMLHRLIDNGEAGEEELRLVAGTVARFHLEAPRAGVSQSFGTVAAVRENWEENFRTVEGMPWISRADFALIRDFVSRFAKEKAHLFEERLHAGFVRECDGDLHLENICLTDRVYIFDCIEFSERLRICDTAADIAFLLMDLEYHDRGDLSPPFLQTYREITGDSGMDPLLDFYKSYRAFVRGKVSGLLLREKLEEPERLRVEGRARRYFRLSRGCALRGKLPPSLFLTCGLTGSGKSTIALELTRQLGCELYQSDPVRKRQAGIPAGVRADAPHGEGIYSADFDRSVYDELLGLAAEALRRGKSVVVDATFRRAADRSRFRALAGAAGVPCHILEVRCDEGTVRERLERRHADPRAPSDGRWEIYLAQKERFEPPRDEGEILLDGALPPEECADRVLRAVGVLT